MLSQVREEIPLFTKPSRSPASSTPSISDFNWLFVKPATWTAPFSQISVQYPQPVQTRGSTTTRPLSEKERASKGQLKQSPQRVQVSWFILASSCSRTFGLSAINALARAAASPAWAMVSVMSFGPWAVPQTKIPSTELSTGFSLECLSLIKPVSSWLTFNTPAITRVPVEGSIAAESTTRSAGSSRIFWLRVSSTRTMRLLSDFRITSAGRPRTKETPIS